MAQSSSVRRLDEPQGGMKAPQPFLPYGKQTIEDDDVAAVAEALRADLLTTGPKVEEYEAAFARATGATHAVACNSGTAALHLAMLGLDLKPDQAAVVPAITFVATANVVRMTGAEVVFADVDPDTGLMTPETLRAALDTGVKGAASVKAAVPVHLNGQLCDMSALRTVANDAGVELVEDACHALGVNGVGSNAYSRLACFSTHAVKAIATGEGGVVTTADADLADRMRRLRTHGMQRHADAFENQRLAFDGSTPNPWYYEMSEIGWNYRLPDVLCALGLSQLKKLERFHRRRREITSMYDRLLAPLAPVIRPPRHDSARHGWHLYVILVDFDRLGMTRGQVMAALRMQGIGTQVHYIPVHHQPYYRDRYGAQQLPGADAYYAHCLSLPIYPAMSDDDVQRVVHALADVAGGNA
jgi:UDP-4-amino-4,6-dideoxy-N-acetyl-beta-L-altrosamine transaminase